MAVKDQRFERQNNNEFQVIEGKNIRNNTILPQHLIESWPVFSGSFNAVTNSSSNYNPVLVSTTSNGFTVNLSSSRLTIQYEGYYHIHIQQLVSTVGSNVYLIIRKNGTNIAYAYSNNDETYDLVVAALIKCSVGDYIDFYYSGITTYTWPSPHSSVSCFLVR